MDAASIGGRPGAFSVLTVAAFAELCATCVAAAFEDVSFLGGSKWR
tara:strand:- start:5 stop:142 length:138 start_codon:yes stop_codon:yes gene_type:complete